MAGSLFTDVATFGGVLGGFKPKALYSFEFRDRANPSDKSEIFLLLPPERYSIEYGYRLTVHKTIGGTSFDWFGTDNPIITLGGSLWSYWIDLLPAPFGNNILGDNAPSVLNDFASSAVNKLAGAASKLVSGFFPLNQMSGLEEFFRLKYCLYDFFSPITGGLAPKSVNTLLGPLPGLKFLRDAAKVGINDLSFIQMIYHDYDDNVHWEVVPSGPLKVRRDSSDPFTAHWEITLTGIRDVRTTPFLVPAQSKKFDADEVMRDIANTLVALNPAVLIENFIIQVEEDVSEIKKLSFDGFFGAYNTAIDEFFLNKKDNTTEMLHQSAIAAETGKNAADQAALLEAPSATDLNDYIAKSSLAQPKQDIITSGRSEVLFQISEWILSAQTLAGMDAYTGRRIAVIDGETGTTLEDLQPISEETFSAAASEAGTVTYREEQWVLYTVRPGDNLGKIAVQQLGDYTRFPEIGRLNNLSMDNFLLDGMKGKTIKLPERKSTNFNNPDNLVYKPNKPDAVDNSILLEELIGRDIELDSKRGIEIDNSGDLKLTKPLDGLIANIADATTFPAGTLSPLYPEWGVDLNIGGVADAIAQEVSQQKIIMAAENDPRVTSANIDQGKIKRVGDTITYEDMSITPIIGGHDLDIGGT